MCHIAYGPKLVYHTESTFPENIFRNVLLANASSSCYIVLYTGREKLTQS